VNFPWAALLRGVLRGEARVIAGLARLAKQGARLELVLTYDAAHDEAVMGDDSLPALDEPYIDEVLAPAYAAHRIVIESRRRLSRDEALAVPSTWGRRLLHGRTRDVFEVVGRRS
jgi:hypothetical protein